MKEYFFCSDMLRCALCNEALCSAACVDNEKRQRPNSRSLNVAEAVLHPARRPASVPMRFQSAAF